MRWVPQSSGVSDGVQTHVRRSQVLFENRHYDEAAAEARAILEGDPRSPLAHTMLARIHIVQGDLDKARSECERAIASNPRQAEARLLIAHIYHRRGLQAQAITAYREALALRSDFTEARLSLAYLYKELDSHREVIRETERALEKEPDLLPARLLLAEARLALGDVKKALEDAREAVRLNPQLPQAHHLAGNCLMSLGRYQEAGRAFDEATAANPVALVGLVSGAARLLEERQLDEALALCDKAEILQPRFAGTAALRGIILLENDLAREAIDSLRQAQRRMPGSAAILYHLGRAYERLGQRLEAETSYQEALRHNPMMGEARARLANLYSARGDGKAALTAFTRTLAATRPVDHQEGTDLGLPTLPS